MKHGEIKKYLLSMVHSPNGYNSWDWAQAEARNPVIMCTSHMGGRGSKYLGYLLLPFLVHSHGARLEAK